MKLFQLTGGFLTFLFLVPKVNGYPLQKKLVSDFLNFLNFKNLSVFEFWGGGLIKKKGILFNKKGILFYQKARNSF